MSDKKNSNKNNVSHFIRKHVSSNTSAPDTETPESFTSSSGESVDTSTESPQQQTDSSSDDKQ